MNKQSLITKVRESLTRHKRRGWDIEVLAEGVRRDDGWWLVPVCPNKEKHTVLYYDILATVESELQDKEGLNIVLIPASK